MKAVVVAILFGLVCAVVFLYINQWQLIKERRSYQKEMRYYKYEAEKMLAELSQEVAKYRAKNGSDDAAPKV